MSLRIRSAVLAITGRMDRVEDAVGTREPNAMEEGKLCVEARAHPIQNCYWEFLCVSTV